MQVHPLQIREALERPSLHRGNLTVGQVKLGQECQPGEGPTFDDCQRIAAQAEHHQPGHISVQ